MFQDTHLIKEKTWISVHFSVLNLLNLQNTFFGLCFAFRIQDLQFEHVGQRLHSTLLTRQHRILAVITKAQTGRSEKFHWNSSMSPLSKDPVHFRRGRNLTIFEVEKIVQLVGKVRNTIKLWTSFRAREKSSIIFLQKNIFKHFLAKSCDMKESKYLLVRVILDCKEGVRVWSARKIGHGANSAFFCEF